MTSPTIRRYVPSDADSLSRLILRNLKEVNSRDYPAEELARVAANYSEGKIQAMAEEAHLYVACLDSGIVGCGAIAGKKGVPGEAWVSMVFVQPELHGYGIGRQIMAALEKDELFLCSQKAVLKASVTALGFYEKLGYRYENGSKTPDEDRVYRMEKPAKK